MTSSTYPPSSSSRSVRLPGTLVVAFWTGSSDGDQREVLEGHRPPPAEIPPGVRLAGLVQVHGSNVVDVGERHDAPGSPDEGDAALAADESTCPAILVADCVPIAIGSPEGIRVALHGGWRSLVGGVVANAAAAAGAAGASRLVAGIGPCIGPCCYEFSEPDLAQIEGTLGEGARAETRTGRPALDVRAAARNLLLAVGAEVAYEEQSCTSCGSGWFSARARSDKARQALYLWRADR